jgi:hypothetical protein
MEHNWLPRLWIYGVTALCISPDGRLSRFRRDVLEGTLEEMLAVDEEEEDEEEGLR